MATTLGKPPVRFIVAFTQAIIGASVKALWPFRKRVEQIRATAQLHTDLHRFAYQTKVGRLILTGVRQLQTVAAGENRVSSQIDFGNPPSAEQIGIHFRIANKPGAPAP